MYLQGESVLIHKLRHQLIHLLKQVCVQFVKKSVMKENHVWEIDLEDVTNLVPLDALLVGTETRNLLQTRTQLQQTTFCYTVS